MTGYKILYELESMSGISGNFIRVEIKDFIACNQLGEEDLYQFYIFKFSTVEGVYISLTEAQITEFKLDPNDSIVAV